MPRVARIVVEGLAHHVTSRGNNRQAVFFTDEDRMFYIRLLRERAHEYGVEILGYCLMPNHVHWVAVPSTRDALAKVVGTTHCNYTLHMNRVHGRCGHLWQGRFYSCPLDEEHCWNALVYVDQNPVRAGLVEAPWEYRWSSAAPHIARSDHAGLINLRRWYEISGDSDWKSTLVAPLNAEITKKLRLHTYKGFPLVGQNLLAQLEQTTGRHLRLRPVGRPKKRQAV